MSITKRHHFIPVSYLKHFTRTDGQFHIFDVQKNEFKNRGQLFHPKRYFFEHDANTFHGLNSTDFIEHQFAKIDNSFALILKKVADGKRLSGLEPMELQYFVNILHWRNPSNADKVKQYVANAKNLSAVRMLLRDKKTGERVSDEEEKQLMSHPEFYKIARFLLPIATFPEIFQKSNTDHAHIQPFPFDLPKIVSDYPIIYRNPEAVSLHHDEFIFPITPNQILFRSNFKKILVWSHTRVLIDMLLVRQARQYISCTDLEYPYVLQKLFLERFESTELLRQQIFDSILDAK